MRAMNKGMDKLSMQILFFFFFFLFTSAPVTYGTFPGRGWIGATADGLCHSHSNVESELSLWTTPQLTAKPDP